MSERRLLVFGAGGQGKVVADAARSAGFVIAAFLDDDPGRLGTDYFGAPVMSVEAAWRDAAFAGLPIALGVGDNRARSRCSERTVAAGRVLANIVHASAVVAPSARLGPGTVVLALAAINPDATIGAGVILNTGCVVEHDCVVDDFAHLSPNSALGGGAHVGARSHLGLGAVVLPGVRVGADVRVGAGAVVHRDVLAGLTVAGVPARTLPRKP